MKQIIYTILFVVFGLPVIVFWIAAALGFA
jgi:hypothetical protein